MNNILGVEARGMKWEKTNPAVGMVPNGDGCASLSHTDAASTKGRNCVMQAETTLEEVRASSMIAFRCLGRKIQEIAGVLLGQKSHFKVSQLQTGPVAEECWPRTKAAFPVLFSIARLLFKLDLFLHSSASQLPAPQKHAPNFSVLLPTARAMITFHYSGSLGMMKQEQ